MPSGDGTGPNGMGSMTGRGMGFCAGYDRPGYVNPGFGRNAGRGFGRGARRGFGRGAGFGFGRGAGRGFGFRRWAGYGSDYDDNYAYEPREPTKNEERASLEEEKGFLEKSLESIKKEFKN